MSESWRETASEYGIPEEVINGAVEEKLGQFVRAGQIAGAIQSDPELARDLEGMAAWMQANPTQAQTIGSLAESGSTQDAVTFAKLAYREAQRRGQAPQGQGPQGQQGQGRSIFEGRLSPLPLDPQAAAEERQYRVARGEEQQSAAAAFAAYQAEPTKTNAERFAKIRLRESGNITDEHLLR